MRARALFRPCARLAAPCVMALLLADCASPRPQAGAMDRGIDPTAAAARDSSLRFQIVYVIHGDAGYLWYDDAGIRHQADVDALAQARRTAEDAAAAEVFIFHQKPTRFLRVFHGADGTLWHYRKGRLLRRVPYARPGVGAPYRIEAGLEPEAELFARFAALPAPRRCGLPAQDPPVRILAYFGHGIPVTGKIPYNRSRPDMAFSLASFSRGLVHFGGPACPPRKPFSLVILSACHGGTPEATLALAPYADWVLAAPGELHLSYLDTRALARLARENPIPFETGHAGLWGRAIAMESFARLGATVRTGVTISLYETARASEYLEHHRGTWGSSADAAGLYGTVAGPTLFAEPAAYRDCGLNPEFGNGGAEAGIQVFHRPARFGIDRGKESHSGWECPVLEPRSAALP